MSDYIIATDADSELILPYVLEKGIAVFPMPLTLNGVEYNYDLGKTVQIPDFFEQIENGATVSTSCKSPWEIKQWFLELLEQGKDILYIGLSHNLSQHFGNCQMAVQEIREEKPDAPRIFLVDTLSISAGQSLLIRKAVALKEQGKPIEEVAQWLEANKQHSLVFFSVDDLNYLKRGGRLSGGAAFFGTVLDLKPILHTSEDGRLEPIEKIKGRKKAWRRMAELVKERGVDLEENEILLLYTNQDDAKVMEANLQELCHPKSIEFWPVGPVIGGHAGPRVMGLACWGTER